MGKSAYAQWENVSLAKGSELGHVIVVIVVVSS